MRSNIGLTLGAKLILNSLLVLKGMYGNVKGVTKEFFAYTYGITPKKVETAFKTLKRKGFIVSMSTTSKTNEYFSKYDIELSDRINDYFPGAVKEKKSVIEKAIEESTNIVDAVKNARVSYRFSDGRQIKN